MNAADLFAPERYAGVRQPLERANALPTWCYTDEAFYRREVESIFLRSWIVLGRAEEFPSPGSYRVYERFSRSIIVVRGRDGALKAFLNACRHRGTRLLEGEGSCRAITCPYHSWAYSLSGQLVAAPGMEGVADFDLSAWPLVAVKLAQWGGFVFVNFDPQSGPLEEFLGDFRELFASHRFEDMKLTRKRSFDLACNWKIYVENAMEDYHTPTVHKSSIGLQKTDTEPVGSGQWAAIYMKAPSTIAVLPGETSPFPTIPTLSAKARAGSFFAVVYPTLFLGVTTDCMWYLETVPHGATRMTVNVVSCFPQDTIARADFAQAVERYYFRWDKSIPEDNAISERQQLGLGTLGEHPMGRLSLHEPVVHDMARWVLDRVLPQGAAAAAR